jgi:hypothetical protein
MGVATGAAHAAVKDSQHRPITAGGIVDNAPIVFVDAPRGWPRQVSPSLRNAGQSDHPGDDGLGRGTARLDIFLLNGSTHRDPARKSPRPEPCFSLTITTALLPTLPISQVLPTSVGDWAWLSVTTTTTAARHLRRELWQESALPQPRRYFHAGCREGGRSSRRLVDLGPTGVTMTTTATRFVCAGLLRR